MRVIFEIENMGQLEEIQHWLADKEIVIEETHTDQRATDSNTVSVKERNRRTRILKKFKGRLAKQYSDYEPPKNEWYNQ